MKNNIKLSLIGILSISFFMIQATINEINYNWIYSFEGKAGDNYQVILENSLGQYVAFGQTNNYRYKGSDVLISTWDKSGRILSIKNVGGLEDEMVFDASLYKEGYLAVGYTKSDRQYPWIAYFDKQLNLVKDYKLPAYPGGVINKLVVNEDDIYLFGHQGEEFLALKTDDSSNIIASYDNAQKGEVVDAGWLGDNIYMLAKSCIDCYSSKSVYSMLFQLDANTLKEKQAETIAKNQIEIATQLGFSNGNLYASGLFFDPKLNVQSSLVQFDPQNLSAIKSASFGRNWEDELLGFKEQADGGFLLYGKSLSDPDSRKRRETYRAWHLNLNKDLELVGEEYFYGKGKYNVYNDGMISIDGTQVLVGSSNDLPFLVDIASLQQSGAGNIDNANKVFLLEDYFVEDTVNETLEVGESFEYVFEIENRSDETINKLKLDVTVEGLDGSDIEVPPYLIIPSLKPRKKTKASIPIVTNKLRDGDFEIIVKLNEQILTQTQIRTKELKKVDLELTPSIRLVSIDSSNFTAIAKLEIGILNIGNKILDNAQLMLAPSSSYDKKNEPPPPIKLAPGESSDGSFELVLSDIEQNELFFNVLIKDNQAYESQEQFSLEINEINKELEQFKASVELDKIKESRATNLTSLVRLSNVSSGLEKQEERQLPTDLPAIEAVTKVDLNKVFSSMSIHWEGVQGRDFVETKKEKANLNVSIQNIDESVDSFRIIYNGKPLNQAKNHIASSYSEEIFENGEGIGKFVSTDVLLLDGKNEFSCEFFVGEHSFVIDDKLNYQYEEEKGTLHLVSIGVPDLVGAETDRLKFTTKDAADFVESFKSATVADDYNAIKEYVLNTEETTSQRAIMEFIRDFELKLESPKDLLVVYLSSHGFISQNNGELYISTSDYSHKSKEFSCINFQDVILLKLLDLSIPKVLFLDVCHSGAIINETDDAEVSKESQKINSFLEEKVAADQQLYMVSSSNKGQYSYEFSKLKNSAFIAAIKESINNESYSACALGEIYPDANNDGVLKLTEMFQFISLRVPCIVKTNRKDAAQNPMSKSIERDIKLFDYF